ncbi:MAG: hypothetical protein AAGF74_08135 [Pseudomonadota bacterium]
MGDLIPGPQIRDPARVILFGAYKLRLLVSNRIHVAGFCAADLHRLAMAPTAAFGGEDA